MERNDDVAVSPKTTEGETLTFGKRKDVKALNIVRHANHMIKRNAVERQWINHVVDLFMIVFVIQTGSAMRLSMIPDLDETGKKDYLNEGDSCTVVVRLSGNLKAEASHKAKINGMSLSAYIRNLLIRNMLDDSD